MLLLQKRSITGGGFRRIRAQHQRLAKRKIRRARHALLFTIRGGVYRPPRVNARQWTNGILKTIRVA